MSTSPDIIRALKHENIRLQDENQALRQELASVRQALHALLDLQGSLPLITPETDVFTLLNRVLSLALMAVNSADGSLLLLDEETGGLVFAEVHGIYRDQLIGYRVPPGEGIVGWSVANRSPRLVPDTRREPLFYSGVDQAIGFESQSILCVPLMDGERALGAIEVVNSLSGEPFEEIDLDILTLVGRLASRALVRAEGVLSR